RTCSPGYAAPEQYSTGTSMRTDIYGLGATLYTLLTGTVPIDALYRMTLIGSGQDDPLKPISEFVPTIPRHIEQAISRALSLNSNNRFANIEEFWQALNAHPTWRQLTAPVITPSIPLPRSIAPLSRKPGETPVLSSVSIHKQKRKRGPRLLLLIAALLLIMLAAGVGFLSYTMGRPNVRSFAPTAHTKSTVTTIVIFPTVTTYPTQVPTSTPRPKVKPTSPSQPVIGPTTIPVVPTPIPTIIPTMRPTPPPT